MVGMLAKAEGEDGNYESRDEAAHKGSSVDEGRSPSFLDSESDEEVAEELQIKTLEKKLVENPMNYEAHVQYIQCLRKLIYVEKLRYARERMNIYFPLSPKMWQEWTKDEVSLNLESENFEEIEKLYERGVHEYLFVPLWCDYLEFVQEHDPLVSGCTPAGVSKMRALFERALTASGLHVSEGSKVWEAYREFEQAIILTIDGSDIEEKVKQAQRIRALFHRQLSVPLINMKSTLSDYKLWEADQQNLNYGNSEFEGVPSNIVSAYQKALEMCNSRASYEEQLSNRDVTEVNKLQHFMNYIKLEKSCCDPARIQVIYERAVTDFPLFTDLWLGYTSYIDRTLKISNIVKDVYSRATRNCIWVEELFINRMLALERMSASEKELSTVFERAIQCSFPSFKEGGELHSICPNKEMMLHAANNYGLNCLSRMLEEVHANVPINATDDLIKAHKDVLSICSPVFERMFLHDLKEKESSVNINDMSLESCYALLRYIYGFISQEYFWRHRLSLLDSANEYDTALLKDCCEESLLKDITTANIFERLEIAWFYHLNKLKRGCLMYLFGFGKIHDVRDEFKCFLCRADRELMQDILKEIVTLWKPF